MQRDFAIGILLLQADFFDLKGLSDLPAVLERLRLKIARTGLLYALGYEDRLRAEEALPPDETPEQVREIFTQALTRTTPGDLPPTTEFVDGQKLELRSRVLGCSIIAEVPNNDASLFLAEDSSPVSKHFSPLAWTRHCFRTPQSSGSNYSRPTSSTNPSNGPPQRTTAH